MHIKAYSMSREQLKENKGAKGLVYRYKFMLIARQSQPHSPNGKMARFGFYAASSLFYVGWGFAVPFYSFQDCNLGQNRWKICTPSLHPSQGWDNGAFWLLRGFILDLRGMGICCSILFCPRLSL